MNCREETPETRTIYIPSQQAGQFTDMLESALQHVSGLCGEPNLSALQQRFAEQPVQLEVGLEEAFDLVQSLTACVYDADWPSDAQHVYDDILGQLKRNPFSCVR